MSGRIVGEVLDYAPEDLTILELAVFVALAESANDRTRRAEYDTTIDAIAHRTRAQPGSVKHALRNLRARGLVIGLHDKPRKGLAQQYDIPRLGPHTRRAVWSQGVATSTP